MNIIKDKSSTTAKYLYCGEFTFDEESMIGKEYTALVRYSTDPIPGHLRIHDYKPVDSIEFEEQYIITNESITFRDAIEYLRITTNRFDLIKTNNLQYISPIYIEMNHTVKQYINSLGKIVEVPEYTNDSTESVSD
jgi:hypothetical protein